MAKDPAFLFYSSDFLTGTMFMTDSQVGKYIRLICAQHQHGGYIDSAAFEQIVGDDKVLRSKFCASENGFFNERLFEEMQKRKQKSSKMAANAKQKQSKSKAIAQPIENENESVIENINTNKGALSKNEILQGIFGDELFVEQLAMTHKGKDIRASFEECYTHHSNAPNPPNEIYLWKQKLNTWLTIKGDKKNGKQIVNPSAAKLASLIEAKYGNQGAGQ